MPWNSENYWMTRDPNVKRGMAMIGAAMRRQRERRGMSQRDLERMTGIHQSTISRLETGNRCGLRWSRFAGIVAVLGGLDFGGGDGGGSGMFGRAGLSPNPRVALQQIEEAESLLQATRETVEWRLAEETRPTAD